MELLVGAELEKQP